MGEDDDVGLEGQFFQSQLGELERRRLLERTGRLAAHIEIDLESSGPLSEYVKSRRLEAGEALRMLTDIDPRDAISITTAQGVVREYLRVCEWVSARIEDAAEADRIIKREYDGEQSEPDQD